MAIINFPASPALNDTYTFGGKTWKWNGVGWQLLASTIVTAPEDASYITMSPEASLTNELVLGTSVIMRGTLAARPAAGSAGRLYQVIDSGGERLTRDNGTSWDDLITNAAFITGTFDMGTF